MHDIWSSAGGPATITCHETPDSRICYERRFRDRQSHGDADRLSQFLSGYVAKDAEGTPRRIGAGPYPGSVFYASTGTFDLAHTCNTWSAEALRAAGLPVSSVGVVYAGQLIEQLPPPAAATPEPNGSEQ